MDFETLKDDRKFFVIAGPCVIESEEHCLKMAKELKTICNRLGLTYIFKASFDKANRTSVKSYRGPGLKRGLEILKKVKETYNLPICTDVHEPSQCEQVAEVADILQIPAFLCRQTDLLLAAGKTNKIIHIKKGQFCSHTTMKHAYQKVLSTGNHRIGLCDRGTMFGYGDLIVDFRNLVRMRENEGAFITQDLTHSLQQPNQTDHSLGLRELIPTIARAAIAVGVDGIFMEVHDHPEKALSDATTQWSLENTESLLEELLDLHSVSRGAHWRVSDSSSQEDFYNDLTVYIGFDSRNFGQKMAFEVARQSIINHASQPVEVRQLIRKRFQDQGIYWRDEDPLASTEFTYTRFLVPYLNGYRGWALFCDSDFLWTDDVWKMFDVIKNDPNRDDRVVYCVKHDYQPSDKFKMDGRRQTQYPRKNWSSCMLFNCGHPSAKLLTLEAVSTQSPAWLHRMQWAKDHEIGELPHTYNYLVGYYQDHNEENPPKVLHYTDGGPWHPGYENVEYGELWLSYLTDEEKQKVFAEREELRTEKEKRMKPE